MRFHLSPSPRDGRHKGPRAVSQQLCVLERVTPPGATPPAQSRIRETTAPLLPDLEQRLRTGPEIAQEAGRPNSPWHLLGSPASTRSAVHPSLPSLCLNHKVIQPLPALTNHLGKRPRKYGSGGHKLGQKIVVKVGQRTGAVAPSDDDCHNLLRFPDMRRAVAWRQGGWGTAGETPFINAKGLVFRVPPRAAREGGTLAALTPLKKTDQEWTQGKGDL